MITIDSNGVALHVLDQGPRNGAVVMFGNSLGTDSRVWDLLLPHLPDNLRLIRYDKRGHGLSDCPLSPYTMQELVDDALCVIDTLDVRDITFVGLSIGGLIGQGIATCRPELLKALVLMDTAAKIGTTQSWNNRVADLKSHGLDGCSASILDRWFSGPLRHDSTNLAPWKNMLERTPLDGYLGCCAAIAHADMSTTTAQLKMPVLAIVGENDIATTPQMMRETAALCQAPCHLVANAGHLPCVEQPAATATLINQFLEMNQ